MVGWNSTPAPIVDDFGPPGRFFLKTSRSSPCLLHPSSAREDVEPFSPWVKLKLIEDAYGVLWNTARSSPLPAQGS
jgi:hypothetical protein